MRGGPRVTTFWIFAPQLAAELNARKRAVDHGFQFMRVLYFAAFGQPLLCFLRAEPCRLALRLIGAAQLVDLHQEGLDHELLHAARLPEHALGVKVEMKVARLNGAKGSGFFRSLPFRGLTVREVRIGRAFGEGPLVP